ncbi:hypothetical protein OG819_11740 [Streptomyces sp. NBC_01549]|uniref:hypothetical protein n=1 Tax=Streptomyces sp. NBC_01549 TaxID=2975874 RepID=UPI0022568CC3|nr:hypothetical protein [Streptomyces sp. NBC_01549]MCX4590406.1 hypothetical protein [Streptomyces sp. NBC_01549]
MRRLRAVRSATMRGPDRHRNTAASFARPQSPLYVRKYPHLRTALYNKMTVVGVCDPLPSWTRSTGATRRPDPPWPDTPRPARAPPALVRIA